MGGVSAGNWVTEEIAGEVNRSLTGDSAVAIENESPGTGDGLGVSGDCCSAGEEKAEGALEFDGIADGWLDGLGLGVQGGEEDEG